MVKKKAVPSANRTYWKKRPVEDMAPAWGTQEHPSRKLLLASLIRLDNETGFGSLLEVGCGVGPNLSQIVNLFTRGNSLTKRLYGVDINEAAVRAASANVPAATFGVADVAEGLLFPDKSFNVVVSQAVMIYLDEKEAGKALKEMARVASEAVVLLEMASKKPEREGHFHSRDYVPLMDKLGFKAAEDSVKLNAETWPEDKLWQEKGWLYVFRRR